MALSKARVVVGLDFGTTFSGFAFAHVTDPEKVYTFFDYPNAGPSKPYCKTVTGMYYKSVGPGKWEFKSWGYPARAEYAREMQALRKAQRSGDPHPPRVGAYITRFKLHLATKDMGATSAQSLPDGLTVLVLITDYLRELGALIVQTLQVHYGSQLSKREIQWCVTVPSIWGNAAKAVMKTSMADAGLVGGDVGSPHPLIMVLEPEAASFFCHKTMSEQNLRVGDKLLVADIGGGTADIVVQEVVSVGDHRRSYKVREVTTSSGGLCGGTYVDQRFMEYLHRTIGPCFHECVAKNLNIYSQMLLAWETMKTSFGDRSTIDESMDINLPNMVVTEWEKYDRRMGNRARDSYDDLELSFSEIQSIFDPVVEQNMQLIEHQLAQAGGSRSVKVLVVVGGFAGSPYLMNCIRKRFAGVVSQIISPPNPGSAVCQGAVMLALHPDAVVSRVCKKTYGIQFNSDFDKKLDLPKYKIKVDGVAKCSHRFEVYVRKGEQVDVESCISRTFRPLYRNQRTIQFQLFSSHETDPRYTVGDGVRKEGEIEIDVSMDMKLDTAREIKVSLFFGGSTITVKAEAVNFSTRAGRSQQVELPVEVGFCPDLAAVCQTCSVAATLRLQCNEAHLQTIIHHPTK